MGYLNHPGWYLGLTFEFVDMLGRTFVEMGRRQRDRRDRG